MVYCCVPICKERQGKVKGLSFHEFPVDPDLRSKWLKAISRKDFVPREYAESILHQMIFGRPSKRNVIMNQVIGKLTEVFTKMCSKPEDSSILAKLLCEKFIKAIIENIAQKYTNMFENIRKFTVKPVNRKFLKLS